MNCPALNCPFVGTTVEVGRHHRHQHTTYHKELSKARDELGIPQNKSPLTIWEHENVMAIARARAKVIHTGVDA